MKKTDVLKQCTVEGNIIKLPNTQLSRKDYLDVKKSLELIGGKWKGGKTYGFVFSEDPSELLKQIANGENRNLKKEFQFFATPKLLALELVRHARIKISHSILEPSAGQGAIVKAINEIIPDKEVFCYELMPTNLTILKKINNVNLLGEDFLNSKETEHIIFDRIIANPPFSKNQDITHVKEMYRRLRAGGRLVTVTSKHWQLSSNKKETSFRNWLKEVNAQIEEIPAGTFKESGTKIAAAIVIIDKV